MFADLRNFAELKASFADAEAPRFESLAPYENMIESYCWPRSAAGLSCNQPINSNLSPPGNNPNQTW